MGASELYLLASLYTLALVALPFNASDRDGYGQRPGWLIMVLSVALASVVWPVFWVAVLVTRRSGGAVEFAQFFVLVGVVAGASQFLLSVVGWF